MELLQSGEMVCVVQEQVRRKFRTHSDPSSKAVLLRSHDGGNTWDPGTKTLVVDSENEAINDPAIKQLKDGTLICSKVAFSTDACASGSPSASPWTSRRASTS